MGLDCYVLAVKKSRNNKNILYWDELSEAAKNRFSKAADEGLYIRKCFSLAEYCFALAQVRDKVDTNDFELTKLTKHDLMRYRYLKRKHLSTREDLWSTKDISRAVRKYIENWDDDYDHYFLGSW